MSQNRFWYWCTPSFLNRFWLLGCRKFPTATIQGKRWSTLTGGLCSQWLFLFTAFFRLPTSFPCTLSARHILINTGQISSFFSLKLSRFQHWRKRLDIYMMIVHWASINQQIRGWLSGAQKKASFSAALAVFQPKVIACYTLYHHWSFKIRQFLLFLVFFSFVTVE